MQNTLAAYNALVTHPSKDMNVIQQDVERREDTDERVDDARERVTQMEAAGDTYLGGVRLHQGIQNTDLREKGQQRLVNLVRRSSVSVRLADGWQGWQQRIPVRRARCGTPCRTFPSR